MPLAKALGLVFVTMLGAPSVATASGPVTGGGHWHYVATPNPEGASNSFLLSVSCPDQTGCVAVGFSTAGDREVPLAERWNGMRWKIVTTPSRPHAVGSSLAAVSCAAIDACVAVGVSDRVSLVERWNDRRWSIVRVPDPPHSQAAGLTGVSCPKPARCIATGYYLNADDLSRPFAEHWDGVAWTEVALPAPPDADEMYLFGMTCTGGADCTAVGGWDDQRFTRHPLIEHWDGRAWTMIPAPDPDYRHFRGAALYGISCAGPSECISVGGAYIGERHGAAVAERWDGSTWVVMDARHPLDSFLSAVACAGSTACAAVGSGTGHPSSGGNLAERWDGDGWALQWPAIPSGMSDAGLGGVACPSSTGCIAVGSAFGGDGVVTTAEQWVR